MWELVLAVDLKGDNKVRGQTNGWQKVLLIACLIWLTASWVLAQNWCRTAEVNRALMQQLGITDEKIRAAFETSQRQAGRELPSFFYGGLGSSFFPGQGLVGTLRGLHILVRPNSPDIYPDPTHTAEYYQRLLFDETNPQSLASYLKEASYGRLRLLGDSFGPVLVNVPVTTTGNVTHIANFSMDVLQAMVRQAISSLDAIVDFSRYDSDGDGRLDLLFITFASDPDTRPPNGNFFNDPSFSAFTVTWGKFRRVNPTIPPLATTGEGVVVECAVFVHEVFSLYGCGVYAHEFGHAFGMPDLYNPDNLSQVDPGAWSLMARGAVFYPGRITLNPNRPGGHPGHLDPWGKIMFGWLQPYEVTRDLGQVVIPVFSEQPVAYRLWAFGSPASNEYFLVVNRQPKGFDSLLPGFGLNIFHIDRSILGDPVLYLRNAVQQNPLRKGVDLVDADDRNDMDNAVIQTQNFDWTSFGFAGFAQGNWGDDGDPFPGRTNNTRFDILSRPSSLSYLGGDSGVRVLDIRPLPDRSVQAILRVAVQPYTLILSPREGEIVYTSRPTLQVQWTAPMGAFADIDPASIQVVVDGVTLPIANPAAVFSEGRQTLRLPLVDPTDPTRALPSGTHTVEVRARNRAGVNAAPVSVTFTILPYQVRARRDRTDRPVPFMISLPYDFQDLSVPPERRRPDYVFGIPLTQRFIARWGVVNAAGEQDYLFSGEFVEQLAAGRAYWVRLTQDTFLSIDAPEVDRTQPFRIANEPIWDRNNLDVGWQQVGNPYPFPVNASAVQVMLPTGQILSLREAVQQGILLGFAYQYLISGGVPSYVPISVNEWVLTPFAGYWIYKFKPCSLVVAPAFVTRGRLTEPSPPSRPLVALEVWGEKAEFPYRLALSANAEPIPAPPVAPGMTAWAGFVGKQGTSRNANMPFMEVPAGKSGRWLLLIRSAQPNQKVTLRWKSSRQGGSSSVVYLTDPHTYRSVRLSGGGEWTVTTDETGGRQLVLTVGVKSEVPLRFVDVKVTRMRGSGYLITGRLTSPAVIQAEIRTLTGRLVRVLPGSDEPKTQVQLLWDGRTQTGERLSVGAFLLRLSARDESGRETQRVVVLR